MANRTAESLDVDATNILLTNLAPLLSLFGERFAQQFLSESFTSQDHILFAIAPLGVLTAVAGAIRVGGASWLKRLVGRARENNATAEMDLMSSVSREVCELWNGKSIVRSTGRPEVKQIIHVLAEEGDTSPKSFITVDALKEDNLLKEMMDAKDTGSDNSKNKNTVGIDDNGDPESGISEKSVHPTDHKDMPPNISLNVHGGSKPIELWVCAITATILQIAVLVWSAITAYSTYARKRSQLTGIKPSIGFPLQVAGTVLLTWGLFLCAGIIDNASCEQNWPRQRKSQIMTVSRLVSSVKATFQARANKQQSTANQSSKENSFRRRDMQLYWVQKQHTAGDNSFDPYILYAGELKSQIYESHRAEEKGQSDRDDVSLEEKPKSYKKTTFAVVIGILGFLAQFQGLRLLNWTCSIAQLIVLMIATILRAWVRRSMNKTPVAVPVNNDYILDNLALAIVGKGASGSKFPNPEALRAPGLLLAFGVTTIPKLRAKPFINIQPSNEVEMKPSLAQQALDLRVRLGRLTKWTGAKSEEAIILSNSIEAALERLSPQLPAEFGGKCAAVLQINTYRYRNNPHAFQEEVELYLIKDGERWKVDDAQLEALLSLVSYSAWVAEQNRRNREEVDRGKTLERLNSSGDYNRAQSVENTQSIGWLRAKASNSQIYYNVIGRSSPKLLCDLFWWISDTDKALNKVKDIGDKRKETVVTFPRCFDVEYDFDSEAKSDKVVKRHTLGFFVKDEASKETGTIAKQVLVWRALTYPDTFWSSECTEQQAFVLHLFSAFMWATMKFIVSASQFHPTMVISSRELPDWSGATFFLISRTTHGKLSLPKLHSDEIENLVQDLQSRGLGTSEEIYRALIPPLSYFDKLPNEAVADWCNERLIGLESKNEWYFALDDYIDLLELVQYREVQDRFAKRAAAIVIGFFFRVIDDPNHKELSYRSDMYNEKLREILKKIGEKTVLKAVMSLEHIIARQKNQKNYSELKNLLRLEPGLSTQALEENASGENALEEDDFSFPNATDVFGWTDSFWNAFELGGAVPKEGSRQVLDLAGQSVFHHVLDRTVDLPRTMKEISRNEWTMKMTESHELLTARCDNQTLLHRAARAGHPRFVKRLVRKDADPNATDCFGRTAVFLAAYHGHYEVVNMLCDKMNQDGRNRKDVNRRNALHYAILNHQEIAAVLEQKETAADLRRHENAMTLEHKEDVAIALIDKGLDITARDILGRTPLWYAASEGMKMVVEHLLKQDRMRYDDLRRPKGRGRSRFSPEQEAERAGHKEIAKMLRDAREERETKQESE